MSSATVSISERTFQRARLVIFAAAVVGALCGVEAFWMHVTADPLADVHAYYDAGARLNAGVGLYAQAATTDEAAFYRYPPLLAIVFRPLAALPFAAAAAIWEAVVIASVAALVIRLGHDRSRTWIALGILALPIAWAVTVGQAQVPLTVLLALGSPMSIALAAQLKLFPAVVALWWVGRRDVRSVARFVAWSLALIVVQLVLEPRGTIDFVGSVGFDEVGAVRNLSPYAVSPVLWAVLVVLGAVAVLRLAATKWGWAAAVALSVLASPRLLVYMLMSLAAGIREPADRRRDVRRVA